MNFNFFNSERIIRLTPITKDTVQVADSIIRNNIKVFPTLPNISVTSLNDLWWTRFTSAQSTYSLYIYAFYPISYLLNAYEITQNEIYLNNALKLVDGFYRWEAQGFKKINKKMRKILHGDHAFSNRTQSLCYLLVCMRHAGKNISDKLIENLIKNGDYLSDIKNYSHYNHGLMMDLSLLGLINTLDGEHINYPASYKLNLIARLNHSISRDITSDGVHVENSPGYHFWLLSFLEKVIDPLAYIDTDLYKLASCVLEKASAYAMLIARPDGSVPAIGDTHAGVKYKISQGLSSKYLKDANKVIFRDPDDTVWAYFCSGYKTHVHKHGDNGAFNLFYKGQDVFIDPGFLNYEKTDSSIEIKKTSFHNTVCPKGENQEIIEINLSQENQNYQGNIGRSKIIGYRNLNEVEIALAKISDYQSCTIDRLIIWVKPNIFLIYDTLDGVHQSMEQFFHVGSCFKASIDGIHANLIDINGVRVCRIEQFQFNEPDNIPEQRATGSIQPGFYAKNFNIKHPSQRIVFETKSDYFLTLVQLGEKDELDITIESRSSSKIYLQKSEKIIELDLNYYISLINS
ncbi:heparinase II/III domain-containing protein [Microbulbifer variabilis]|uniref:Heparinase II/III family protein n=1 Tax=Microbulbifer variabilis TaxID=266805 RepID=A0ABY4VKF4_9GAMM|nr:heparinase II/III family protein [Microbulbifer variabilis]USD22389.1 heparinase II/III family protein [Microbulbifer variabilis]